ncbi:MAG: hypothetical protein AAB874_05030 [Patescibacteria group bacterium]
MSLQLNSNNLNHNSTGQSLVEIIVGLGVISSVLGGLMSAITFSTSNTQFARNKTLATKYSQEAVEWLRVQRDANWYTFNSRASSGGSVYCFNTLTWNSGSCISTETINDDYDIFRREVTLSNPTTGRVNVAIRVYWQQGARTSDVQVNTYLTRWQ